MNIKYRLEIDDLGAFAVVVVIFYHAQLKIQGTEIFNGGFISVSEIGCGGRI